MIKVYVYDKCSTCRKAIKFLNHNDIAHTVVPVRETPPTPSELRKMLKKRDNNVRALFNTSGRDYRSLGIRDKLATLSRGAAIDLLASNGNLVRRPFLIGDGHALNGFNEEEWVEDFL